MVPVGFSFLGVERDAASPGERWDRFRPTVAFGLQQTRPLSALVIGHWDGEDDLLKAVSQDIRDKRIKSHLPELTVTPCRIASNRTDDYFDLDFCAQSIQELFRDVCRDTTVHDQGAVRSQGALPLVVNMNTGTHAMMLATYLIAFLRLLPLELVQVAPGKGEDANGCGATAKVLDFDLTKYRALVGAADEGFEQWFKGVGIRSSNLELKKQWGEMLHVGCKTDDPILLLGPTGTGKSFVAKKLHEGWENFHGGADRPFVAANCAGLPAALADSMLFGHVKGAFTGAIKNRTGLLEAATGGTLFLDEIAELDLEVQAKLLKAIEEKTFSRVGEWQDRTAEFRLICATNRDLQREVGEGRFRRDLYARVSCWRYEMPSLRRRLEDLPELIDRELKKLCDHALHERQTLRIDIDEDAQEKFVKFAQSEEAVWANNLRDIQQSVLRMARRAALETNSVVGRIRLQEVDVEIEELRRRWDAPDPLACMASADESREAVVRKFLALAEADARAGSVVERAEAILQDWTLNEAGKNKAEAGRRLYRRARGRNPQNFSDAFTRRRKKLDATGR